MRNFLFPVLFALSLSLAAPAESLRNMTDAMNLNSSQRQQISQILGSGNCHDPATRQRMQQQIMNVLDPQQRNQLAYQIQQQAVYNGYDNNGAYSNYTNANNNGYYNNGYNNGNYNNGYNSNYNNANYNNGNYNNNNGYNNANNVLQNLINSGILNGVLQNLINR